MITPEQVERRLYELSKEIDSAHYQLAECETEYHTAKADYEVTIAKARLGFLGVKGFRVQDVADRATVQTETEYRRLQTAEAMVKAARANSARLRVQVDITRSIGTSVRVSMEVV